MNDNAKRWVEALRSGKFKQGKNKLTTIEMDGTETDCCLGVACKLFTEACPNVIKVERVAPHRESEDIEHTGKLRYVYKREVSPGRVLEDVEDLTLPEPVMEWLGMRSVNGDYTMNDPFNGKDGSLTMLNDDGVSFDNIARKIESEPEGLFSV